MEMLKPIDEIIEPDCRNRCFSETLAELYSSIAELKVPKAVPEPLSSAFAVACNLWLYGWFFYPFYTLSEFEAYRCIEMALILRCRDEGLPEITADRTPPLARLLEIVIKKGWLCDTDFEHFRRTQGSRRGYEEILAASGHNIPAETQEPDRYVKILNKTLPSLRNSFAHPKSLTILPPAYGLGSLTTARDVIQKLFPKQL